MRELKRRCSYEKPSIKKKRKSLEAERRRRKACAGSGRKEINGEKRSAG